MNRKESTIIVSFTRDDPEISNVVSLLSSAYPTEAQDNRNIGGPDLPWLPYGLAVILGGPIFWSGKVFFEKLGGDVYELLKVKLAGYRCNSIEEDRVSIAIENPTTSVLFCFYLPPYGESPDNTIDLVNMDNFSSAMDSIPGYLEQFEENDRDVLAKIMSPDIEAIALHYDTNENRWKIRQVY